MQAKPEAWSQVLWAVPSPTPRGKASLQAGASQKVENLWCFSRVIPGEWRHKKGSSRRDLVGTRCRRQRGVQSRSYLGQCGLQERVWVRPTTRALLPCFVEGLPQGRKYLGTIIGSPIPKKDDQLVPQRWSWQADNNLLLYRYASVDSQAHIEAHWACF